MKNELLNNGYKQFKPDFLHRGAISAYQKAIRGDSGKLYFINVYEYEPYPPVYDKSVKNSFVAESQFKSVSGQYFDVNLHSFESVQMLETFYQKIWELGCIPYDQ